jgi:Transglutaminase-like superfamily
MSRSTPRAVASVSLLIVAATAAWSSVIPVPPLRLAVVAAFVAVPALLAAGAVLTAVLATIVVSAPATMLLSGIPIAAFAPAAWPSTVGRLGAGAAQVVMPGTVRAATSWSIAAVMLVSGAFWTAGSVYASPRVVPGRRSIAGFALLVLPWLLAVGRLTPDHAAWQGAIVLFAGALWFPCSQQAIPLTAVAALLSVPLAQAVGPRARWFGVSGAAAGTPAFQSLEVEPSYGPLTDRRSGAPMLEVTAPRPALWRMQTLDEFDGHGWTLSFGGFADLPEPAAQRETVSVRVLGLHDDLVVAPGRIVRVSAKDTATQTAGEAWRLAPLPDAGDTYRVTAAYVHPASGLLASDRTPLDPGARAYTKLRSPATASPSLKALTVMLAPFGFGVGALNTNQPPLDARVVALARRVAAGASSEWVIVERVERFLLGGGRFRYTTRVPQPGPTPLVDFLLRTHAGYCQQFAGAAALLLRLAGVPARVAVGFATGAESAPGRYTVRDLDAHEWIEVYFEGYGWVPFNPTPAADPASVAPGVDPFTTTTSTKGPVVGPLAVALAILAAIAFGIARRRRRQRDRRTTIRALERIARRTGSHVERSTTLHELAAMLARVGPRTAALAAELERTRFGSGSGPGAPPKRKGLAPALAKDIGALRALAVWSPLPRFADGRWAVRDRANRPGDQVGRGRTEQH